MDGDGFDDFVMIQGGLANNTSHVRIYDEETGELIIKKYNKKSITKAIDKLLKSSDKQLFKLRLCRGWL